MGKDAEEALTGKSAVSVFWANILVYKNNLGPDGSAGLFASYKKDLPLCMKLYTATS
jgi:hypothetical protein